MGRRYVSTVATTIVVVAGVLLFAAALWGTKHLDERTGRAATLTASMALIAGILLLPPLTSHVSYGQQHVLAVLGGSVLAAAGFVTVAALGSRRRDSEVGSHSGE